MPAAAVLLLLLQVVTPTPWAEDPARLGLAAGIEAADRAFVAGRWDEARRGYEALLSRVPEPLTVTLHEQIARCHAAQGQPAQALGHLQVLLDRNPANLALRARMADEALRGGLVERGRALLRSIHEADVAAPKAWLEAAIVLVNAGRPDDALSCLGRALERDPGHVDALFQRGFLLIQLQRRAEARTDLLRVLALAPADSLHARIAVDTLAALR
ncbi:MAG: tetratricopeptide repeat protein [Vicinamibacteria bacterium]|jgi:tetratricopeptide (TPR) repeat protein|nr:tetratricopeptide repeat protein [Vicinamibacteria bacterium]